MRGSTNFQIQEAVKRAIDECIENNVLAEFLRKRRADMPEVSDEEIARVILGEESFLSDSLF